MKYLFHFCVGQDKEITIINHLIAEISKCFGIVNWKYRKPKEENTETRKRVTFNTYTTNIRM